MYKKNSHSWMKHMDFIILDLVCLHLAFIFAYICRHGADNPYSNPLYKNMAVFITVADIAVMFFAETFKGVLGRGYFKEFTATIKHGAFVELCNVMYLFSIQESSEFSRTVMYMMGAFYVILSYVSRIAWKNVLRRKMTKGKDRSLLIVTSSDIATQVVSFLKEHNYEMFNFAGVVLADRDGTGETIEGLPVVTNIENAADYVCREWIDEVLVNQSPECEVSQSIIDQFMETGITLHFSLEKTIESQRKSQFIEKIGGFTVLTTTTNCMSLKQAFMKRTVDIAAGLAGCILTLIIFVFVAPAIYIQSPGPIFFSQTRIGKNGKKFKMYKFRSMYMDAEERKKELMKDNRVKDGMMFKLEFDPRVIGNKVLPNGERKTGVGEFLRVTSLDEFPQFFNVLKGDMSLIGTRPPTVEEFNKYKLHHRARLATKPGITGMWQVSGRSDITDFEEVVKLDTKYIDEWSMGLDFKILLKTVLVVFKKEGSM